MDKKKVVREEQKQGEEQEVVESSGKCPTCGRDKVNAGE